MGDLGDMFGLSRQPADNANRVAARDANPVGAYTWGNLGRRGDEMNYAGDHQNRGAGPQLDQRQIGQFFGAGATAGNAQRNLGAQQQGYINNLQSVAAGTAGPSAAELAMQRASQDTAQQQLAQAAAAGGGPGGVAASLRAQNANATAQGSLQRDLGVQRAEEQAAARQMLGGAMNDARAAEIQAAGMYTGLGTNMAQANQAAQLQTMSLDDSMRQFYYGQQNQLALGQNQAGQAYAGNNVGYLGALESADASRYGTREQADQARFGGSIGMVGAAAGAMAMMSDERAKTNITPASEGLSDAFRAMADRGKSEGASAQPWQAALGTLAAGFGGFGAEMTGGPNVAGDMLKKKFGSDTTSDVRAKTAVGETRGALADAFRELPAYTYRYREPEKHGYGPQAGIMAQDLERNPLTASAVETGPDGMKRVDGGKLATMTAAEVANMRRELDDVQKRTVAGIQGRPVPSEADRLAAENDRDARLLEALTRAQGQQTEAVRAPQVTYPSPYGR